MPQSRIRRYLRHGTLPQLAVFAASARLQSFTRAALELHLAQPTVSAQMKKLTETIGAPLFEQIGKRIYLTEAGRRTYSHCESIFRALEDLDNALGELRSLQAGVLRIAAGSACEAFAARAMASFASAHPGVAVSMHVGNRELLAARMARNEDDLYLVATPPADREFVRQAVRSDPLVVVAHANDPLAATRAISLSRLADAPLALRERGSSTRAAVDQVFAEAGLAPAVRMEMASDGAVRDAIAAGGGVGFLSRSMADGHELVELAVEGFPIERRWHFVYPIGREVSRAARAFMDHVRGETRPRPQSSGAQKAVGTGPGP